MMYAMMPTWMSMAPSGLPPHVAARAVRRVPAVAIAIVLVAAALGEDVGSAGAGAAASGNVPIRFEGLLPGATDASVSGRFHVEFRIYRSPQGGEPIWRETLDVEVAAGRMDVELGRTVSIPDDIHELTFKFLGASVDGQPEVYPRSAIVNVVYASAGEVLRDRRRRADRAYRSAGTVAAATEAPATWRQALERARAAGGDLPDYEAWYAALLTATAEEVNERTDRYEWVLPWVYDPASHGEYSRYFRGRLQGCDYMDLSPRKAYPYRVARPKKESDRPAPARTERL